MESNEPVEPTTAPPSEPPLTESALTYQRVDPIDPWAEPYIRTYDDPDVMVCLSCVEAVIEDFNVFAGNSSGAADMATQFGHLTESHRCAEVDGNDFRPCECNCNRRMKNAAREHIVVRRTPDRSRIPAAPLERSPS